VGQKHTFRSDKHVGRI